MSFEKAKKELQEFLNSKSISNVEIFLSDELPQANKISGKYNHIYKDFEESSKIWFEKANNKLQFVERIKNMKDKKQTEYSVEAIGR